MVKLTERQEFNRWYVNTFSDPDGKFTHMPRWLKDDLWLAWQASRLALSQDPKVPNNGG